MLSTMMMMNNNVLNFTSSITSSNGSAYFLNASSTHLSIANNSTFTLGTNNHTIEFWCYQTARGTYDSSWVYDHSAAGPVTNAYYFDMGASYFNVNLGTGSSLLQTTNLSSNLPSLNAWHHYAIVRNANTITLYVDGTSVGTITTSQSIPAQNGAMWMGGTGTSGQNITGYVTDLRVVNGTAVYTSNFSPPLAPLTAIANTVLLLNESSSTNLLQDSSSYNWTITNNNVTWSSNTPYGGMVQGSILYNLDMKNYVSGNTWPDSSGHGYNFTFYSGSGTSNKWTNSSNVINLGTNTAYFHANTVNWAEAPSAIMNPSANYTKGAVVRGTGANSAPMGSGYLQCSAEARDTTWFNNGTQTFAAGNHYNGATYSDVSQTVGGEANNTWYYVSTTYNTSTGWTLYVNGNLVGSSNTVLPGPTATTPVIGATQTIPGFTGDIAAAHSYTRALSAAEHLQNANYWLSRYNGSLPV